jgi:peptide/nickel transport system substrate-binding protein
MTADIQKNRTEARAIIEKLGYGPNHRMNIAVSTRDLPAYRDPAVILIDQLKEVYIEGELEPIDTTNYFPRIRRKDFTVGLSLQTSGPDPDPTLDLFYSCGSNLNWDGYWRRTALGRSFSILPAGSAGSLTSRG